MNFTKIIATMCIPIFIIHINAAFGNIPLAVLFQTINLLQQRLKEQDNMSFNPIATYGHDQDTFKYILEENEDPSLVASITLAYAGESNAEFKRERNKEARNVGNREPTPEKDTALMAIVFAKAIVKGWENISLPNKKTGVVEPLLFSENNCIRLLKSNGDFFADIKSVASSSANFKNAVTEADIAKTVEEAKKS